VQGDQRHQRSKPDLSTTESFMRNSLNPIFKRSARVTGAALLTTALVAAQSLTAFADIDNTATATGTGPSGSVNSPTSSAAVPVGAATPTLTVSKSVAAPSDTNGNGTIGAGDTLTYTYNVTNTGNVTINNVSPVDAGPTFNTIARVGTLSAYTPASANLAPGASQSFTATYVLQALDVYRAAGILAASGNAVENSATATGTPVRGTLGAVTPSTAETQLPAVPALTVAKAWAFRVSPAGDVNGNGLADTGDVIVYSYTVTNSGNVAITSVSVNDIHEGAALPGGSVIGETQISAGPFGTNSDATANNGVWSNLTPASVVRFFYTHTVTATEFNNG
jgi:uncharacterized repeat protein (TIGR01451 family)